jgi:ribokinase
VICTLGDLLLDVIVRLDGPIVEDTDTYGRTRVGPGGQAANVAAWVVALGGGGRVVAKTARDPAGRLLMDELLDRGVEVAGPQVDAGTGTVVSLVRSDGRRTMLTDRGIAPELAVEELQSDWFLDCEWLHVPAYSLVRAPIGETARAAIAFVRAGGGSVSVDLSATSALAEAASHRFGELLTALAPDVVFGNEAELELVGTIRAPTVVEKRGARGCSVRRGDEIVELPARPTDVVDTTGAGDAFAAGFLVAGADLGLLAAARCVGTMGAMP